VALALGRPPRRDEQEVRQAVQIDAHLRRGWMGMERGMGPWRGGKADGMNQGKKATRRDVDDG